MRQSIKPMKFSDIELQMNTEPQMTCEYLKEIDSAGRSSIPSLMIPRLLSLVVTTEKSPTKGACDNAKVTHPQLS